MPAVEHKTYSGCMNSAHVVPWLSIIWFFLPVTSTTNLRQQARTPQPCRPIAGSQEMSRDESGTPTTLGMAATLTTEAELKAWYLANNPTLSSQSLSGSCPKAPYKETQRDLRYYNTMVAIIPVIDSERWNACQWSTIFGNAKPDQVTC